MKYVITSKTMAAAPQYTIVIKDWKTGVPPKAGDFSFDPPPGVKRLDARALSSFDEVPPERAAEGQK
jgi:hypothetical protein